MGRESCTFPSVFISYLGDALDERTILLRSSQVVSEAVVELLHLIGDAKVKRVHATLGTEQEFFLVDHDLYSQRPDLKHCGRTLIGAIPPKHQQLEDHYFGSMPSRVLATISEAELELWKLGVPLKTRHNEVAPHQFEVAPIFEEAAVAVDHNLLTMQVLHRVAHRHGLKALFHEKPFAPVNGSGKHCNWSLCTDGGQNLLEPTEHPEDNIPFLTLLTSILVGLHKHSGLLRAAIASASNEHRLGANEAPPSIISAFLGAQLTAVLDQIERGAESITSPRPSISKVQIGRAMIDVHVSTLPEINKDSTDRNRTSPFAFTGNKFEFRAVGSKQSPSFPVAMLNALTAAGAREVSEELRKKGKTSAEDIRSVLRHFITRTKAIRFEGDGYSEAWAREAERRGLLNIRTAPEAFKQLLAPANVDMLVNKMEILTLRELNSRYQVLLEKYSKDMHIEAGVMKGIINQQVIPAAIRYRKELATTVNAVSLLNLPCPERAMLERLGDLTEELVNAVNALNNKLSHAKSMHEAKAEAEAEAAVSLADAFAAVRRVADAVEEALPEDTYPLPSYSKLLFY